MNDLVKKRIPKVPGDRFGMLVLVEPVSPARKNQARWLCKCDCGNTCEVDQMCLVSGGTKSCGCFKQKKAENLMLGKKFGRLTVVECVKREGCNTYLWRCTCDCGGETVTRKSDLLDGGATSCGCFRTEKQSERWTTHGRSKTPLYFIWDTMMQRCTNPNSINYPRYGARGITVCDKWQSFEGFMEDMDNRPSKEYSLERIDNTKGYCKENCKWATMKEQGRNRRNNKLLEYNGELLPMAEVAEREGLDYRMFKERIRKGWTVDVAIARTKKGMARRLA